jgi:hypothetical protein
MAFLTIDGCNHGAPQVVVGTGYMAYTPSLLRRLRFPPYFSPSASRYLGRIV